MSYIIKDTSAFVNTKLTDRGRQKLSLGSLNFTYFRLGDSEVSYNAFPLNSDYSGYNIFRPKDNNPDIKYPLIPTPSNPTGSTFVSISNLSSAENVITNVAKTRGFFSGSTDNYSAITTSTYVKQVLHTFTTGLTGTDVLEVFSGSQTSFIYQPAIGDRILLKVINPFVTQLGYDVVESDPVPYLWYQIEGISGTTSANTLTLQVDRTLPNFGTFATGNISYVHFFPSGDTINEFYGYETPTPYWNENTLTFDSNCDNSNLDVPVWNLSIPYSETMAGVSGGTHETYEYYASSGYVSTKEYLDYGQLSGSQKSIAIIHYTNNSISNFYGEGFYNNTTKVHIPTLMYHRRTFTGGSGYGDQIGYTFSADTALKQIVSAFDSDSVINYYDLVDHEPVKTIVGKVFPDLKIVVFDDEEIVAALSNKANRNWTLPKPIINTAPLGTCDTTSTTGILKNSSEELYLTYLIESTTGCTTGLHCQYYTNAYYSGGGERDVTLEFPTDSFPYLNDIVLSGGTGFNGSSIKLIYQKVGKGAKPQADNWKIVDVTYQLTCSTCPLDGKDLERTKFYLTDTVDSSGVTYDLNSYLNIPEIGETTKLQFGDESFFYGNIDTSIKATIYRSLFSFIITGDKFALSQNPTYDNTIDTVNITEIGVYDSDYELVGIGKLSDSLARPLNSGVINLNITIDF